MSDTRTESVRLADEAEAEALEAEAQATAARQRAQELRERRSDPVEVTVEVTVAEPRRSLLNRVPGRAIAESAAGIAVLALIAGSAFFLYQSRQADVLHTQQVEFAEAARQGVVNLMSLDFNNAQADIQRVIDGTTGEFHDDFANSTNDFMTVMKESKVVTTATVNATAVEAMSEDSAIVLVAATSQVANSVSMQANPRIWRLSVTVDRVDDQIKMSKVEFVP